MEQFQINEQFNEYLQNLAKNFQSTYQGASTQIVFTSQQFIDQQYQNEQNNFIDHLLILFEYVGKDELLQQSILSYLEKISQQNNFNANEQQIKKYLSTMLAIIKNDKYSLRMRQKFKQLLSHFFLFDRQTKKKVVVEAKQAFNNSLNLKDSEAMLIIFNSLSKLETNYIELASYYGFCEILGKNIINCQNEQNLQETFEALMLFMETQKQIIFNLKNLDQQENCYLQILKDESASTMFEKLINLQCSQPNCILSNTGTQEIDTYLCTIKADCLNVFNSIMDYMFEVETKKLIDIVEQSSLTPLISRLLPTIINTLEIFCQAQPQQIDQILESKQWQSLIYECLFFLTKCGTQTEYYKIFLNNRTSLKLVQFQFIYSLINIILTLLRTYSHEYNMIQNSPEEFVQLSLDTCDKQESQICKTQAAQLLETLLDHIDGSITMIANLLIEIINDNIIGSELAKSNSEISQKLKDFVFLQQSTPEIQVETALVGLSVMSYVLSKRNDIILEMNKMLIKNFYFFTKTNSSSFYFFFYLLIFQVLLSARLVLFIGYYYDDIFQNQSDHNYYHAYIQYLGASISSEYQLISLQAVDTLQNVLTTDTVSEKVQPVVTSLLELLNSLVVSTNIIKLFDLIDHILTNFCNIFEQQSDFIIQTVSKLVERILLQLKQVSNQKKGDMFITKCWNVIRTFSRNSFYSLKFRDQVEEALNPIFSILLSFESLQFEEDIVLLVGEFIKKNKSVTIIERNLLPFLVKVAQKNSYVLGNMFQTFNYYISYDQEIMTTSADYIQMLIQIAIDVMMAKNNNVNEEINSEGCILLQLILQYFNQALNYQQILLIYMKAVEKAQQQIQQKFLQARIAGIFLSGFAANFQLTQQALCELQALSNVIQFIISDYQKYVFNYEKKIFILGICVILKQPYSQMMPQIQEGIIIMLQSLIKVLLEQQAKEEEKKHNLELEFDTTKDEFLHSGKKNTSNQNKDYDDDDDDDFESDEFDDSDNDESDDDKLLLLDADQEKAKRILNLLVSSANQIDEYQQFKEMIYAFRENNPQLLSEFTSSLKQPEIDSLKQLMLVQRIQINIDNQTVTTNGRVILKPKMRKKFQPINKQQ